MKHVNYSTASVLHKLGFDEYTEDLYMDTPRGIRAVKGPKENPHAERTWEQGTLAVRDEDWEISYPSAHWIPAPYVFQAVSWLESYMGINIIPLYNQNTRNRSFNIEIPAHLYFLCPNITEKPAKNIMLDIKHVEYSSLEMMFNEAVNYIANLATNDNWVDVLEEKYWKTIVKNSVV